MHTFDDAPLQELIKILNTLNKDNIGDSIVRALELRSIILDPNPRARADEILVKIRALTRNADFGWKVFEKAIDLKVKLTEIQT